MNNGPRTIRVTAGAVEYVTGRVEELNGGSLASATFEVGLGTYDTPPGTWVTPADLEYEGASTALVSMLVDDNVTPMDKVWLWVRTTDTPEILPRRCEGGYLTIE